MGLNNLSDWDRSGQLSPYPQSAGQQMVNPLMALIKMFQANQKDKALRTAAGQMLPGQDLPPGSITQEDFGKMAIERAKPQSQEWHPKSLEEALTFEQGKRPSEWKPQSMDEALQFEKSKVGSSGGNVKEEILRKMSSGEPLTPPEQRIYDEIIAKEKEWKITGSDVNALKPGFIENLFGGKGKDIYQKAKTALGNQVSGIKRGKTSSGIGFTIGE